MPGVLRMERKSKIDRKTKETDVFIELNLDKAKVSKIETTIPFLDHMLTLFAHHSGFGLNVRAKGDTHIDAHHLCEDLGITMGLAFAKAIQDKKGINRYGNFLLPMDEALSYVALDISGRAYLQYDVKFKKDFKSEFDYSLIKEFFYAFVVNAKITLHIELKKGGNNHHIAEAIFKGFAKALSIACARNKNGKVPSTKGKL